MDKVQVTNREFYNFLNEVNEPTKYKLGGDETPIGTFSIEKEGSSIKVGEIIHNNWKEPKSENEYYKFM